MLPRPEVRGEIATVFEELEAALGAAAVLSGEDIPQRNESDWSGLAPSRPLAVLRPDSPEGVAAAVRICVGHGIAVVPQGGLTGLCGGARADGASVALSLERLTGVEEIDTAAATLTVRAGTPLQVVQQAAERAGFLCPLDLGARGSCTIGGFVAPNVKTWAEASFHTPAAGLYALALAPFIAAILFALLGGGAQGARLGRALARPSPI